MNYKIIHLVKVICFVLALGAFIFCGIAFQRHSLELIQLIHDLGWLAPILFIITYCLATLMLLPTMILTLAGGAIFGPVFGLILNLFGATSGAALAFLITRHWAYNWFLNKRGEKFNKLIAGVDKKGWVFVAFLRLVPIIPFNLVNYGMGITGMKFRLYLITTFIFLIPAEIIYTYFGYVGMDALSRPGHFYKNGALLLFGITLLFLCMIKFINRKKRD